MNATLGQWRYFSVLIVLFISAVLLAARFVYWYMDDPQRFPINTIKITASYDHISQAEIARILNDVVASNSFFTLPMKKLYAKFAVLSWLDHVQIMRIWPDTLKVIISEEIPVALWNNAILTQNGKLLKANIANNNLILPTLIGPQYQQQKVLQIYKKMSKILKMHNLFIDTLKQYTNQSWEITLNNGIRLYLGNRDLKIRLIRFCKAYAAVISSKSKQLVSVNLCYPRGMAVQWEK